MNPKVLIGAFIGGMASFLFCGLTMGAVGRAAQSMVEEVRRQFREIKGILEGKATPDYGRCVAISTRSTQREMVLPSLLAIAIPVVVGMLLGMAGVMGLLVGGLTTGFTLAVFMANSGGAWDNAKKLVEEGELGGKGSPCHKATVVGDTVGDPFKDTSSVAQHTHQADVNGQHCDGRAYRGSGIAAADRGTTVLRHCRNGAVVRADPRNIQ